MGTAWQVGKNLVRSGAKRIRIEGRLPAVANRSSKPDNLAARPVTDATNGRGQGLSADAG